MESNLAKKSTSYRVTYNVKTHSTEDRSEGFLNELKDLKWIVIKTNQKNSIENFET